jgi:hypothetical protein
MGAYYRGGGERAWTHRRDNNIKIQHMLLRPCYIGQISNYQHHPESEWKGAYVAVASNIMQTDIQHQQYYGIYDIDSSEPRQNVRARFDFRVTEAWRGPINARRFKNLKWKLEYGMPCLGYFLKFMAVFF